MIGYYVHHHGSGHRNRALTISRSFAGELTGLSTLPRPDGWTGEWIDLPDDAEPGAAADATANGRLHYVPLARRGLSARMAKLARWFHLAQPDAVVVDVSVEVAVLARLHGVAVITMAQPGVRSDPAHRLGFDLADTILAPWPALAGCLWAGEDRDLAKTTFVGPISRFPVGRQLPPRRNDLVVVLNGTGGSEVGVAAVEAARSATPGWEWVFLDRSHGRWVADPSSLLASAAVVISHAGQNAIAELAALRCPAVIIPQQRPFDEQHVMAEALVRCGLPLERAFGWPSATQWPGLLARVSALDGAQWERWSDGRGAAEVARVLTAFEQTSTIEPLPLVSA